MTIFYQHSIIFFLQINNFFGGFTNKYFLVMICNLTQHKTTIINYYLSSDSNTYFILNIYFQIKKNE